MTQLVVKEGTFAYRWFAWSLEVIERFSVRPDNEIPTDYLSNGTNLCHMMRVCLIWAPLIFLIEAASTAAVIYWLIVWPIQRVGLYAFYLDIAIRIGIVAFGVGIGWIWTLPRVSATAPVQRGIRLSQLFGEMLLAQKQKICPFVVFDRKEGI